MNLILNVNKNFDELVDASRKDIWRYSKLLGSLKNNDQIDPRQTDFTTVEKVGKWLIKREDKSFVGSHKFRALAFQLSWLAENKIRWAVLSSSGNAAIAASKILPSGLGLKVFAFLSRKTPPEKLAALKFSENFVPILSDRPLRMAKYAVKHFKLNDLRPSQDQNAVAGFRSLGFEIFEQNPNVENIFSFATSFASVRGMQAAFQALVEMGALQKAPQIFAVVSSGQLAGDLSAASNPRVDTALDKNSTNLDLSTSVDNIRQVDISDKELIAMQEKFSRLETSNEGFASLAAAEKIQPAGESLVILTGRAWPKAELDLNQFEKADNFAEVDKIVARHGT